MKIYVRADVTLFMLTGQLSKGGQSKQGANVG